MTPPTDQQFIDFVARKVRLIDRHHFDERLGDAYAETRRQPTQEQAQAYRSRQQRSRLRQYLAVHVMRVSPTIRPSRV